MTSRKNSIAFPVLDTFLKLLSDRQWHNKAFVKNDWKQAVPPEYFARRKSTPPCWSSSKGKVVSVTRTIDSMVGRLFSRTVVNSLNREYIEIRELGAKQFENYDIRITETGMLRLNNKATGSRFLTINGETLSITVWCKKLDVDYQRFKFWLDRKKVPVEEAIANSKNGAHWFKARLITHNGETKTLAEWCRVFGFNNADRNRLREYLKVMTVEGAFERCKETKKE